jgi:hypothetical protein
MTKAALGRNPVGGFFVSEHQQTTANQLDQHHPVNGHTTGVARVRA